MLRGSLHGSALRRESPRMGDGAAAGVEISVSPCMHGVLAWAKLRFVLEENAGRFDLCPLGVLEGLFCFVRHAFLVVLVVPRRPCLANDSPQRLFLLPASR